MSTSDSDPLLQSSCEGEKCRLRFLRLPTLPSRSFRVGRAKRPRGDPIEPKQVALSTILTCDFNGSTNLTESGCEDPA